MTAEKSSRIDWGTQRMLDERGTMDALFAGGQKKESVLQQIISGLGADPAA